ncbi:MAG: cupin [candidate division Zixibacteria bacterium SM23_73_3]|nr:MAG: cupin [candidate division Zixibacteria bacterium SM23_73_3]
MKIANFTNVEAEEVGDPGARGVTIRWLISEKDGAPHFAMRLFEVEPDGYTPYHKHKWEHEVFILKGEGELITENKTSPLKQGDAVFVPGEENHQFKNTSRGILVFLCMVPIEK